MTEIDPGQGSSPETCDGRDNDCSGLPDDSIPSVTCYTGPPGSEGVGICAGGDTSCVGGTLSCGGEVLPGPETCDGFDNDCDGVVDDGDSSCGGICPLADLATACDGPDADSCTDDLRVCDGRNATACPTGEDDIDVCDGLDNDCNQGPDDPFECILGAGRSCTTGCGTTGSQTCGATCTWSTCVPPGEACGNGIDDNCDGVTDPPCASGTTCLAGACRPHPPCTLVTFGGHSYAVCTGTSSWTGARAYCASYGWYLTTIGSSSENTFLLDRIAGEAWIGYNDISIEGGFVWASGESSFYTAWCGGEPNNEGGSEDCTLLVRSAFYCGSCRCWNDARCSEARAFICEWGS